MAGTGQPPCFGKLWDPHDVECTGGPDAAFKDANGNHVRERCVFFEQCGATCQAAAITTPPHLTQLRPNNTPPPGRTTYPQTFGTQLPQTTPTTLTAAPNSYQQQHQQQNQQHQLIQQLLQQITVLQRNTPNAMMMAPQQLQQQQQQQPYQMMPGYQQMMPVNFAIPQYLTVREERAPDGSVWGMLLREIARSMGKSFGHTLSNFFDSTPWYGPK